ncbi:MAG: NUDIX hydrolase [Deltaproteobacteria bacterium]|nr:NUDIX hydrolase [Deltaproteobacteria bacterium]
MTTKTDPRSYPERPLVGVGGIVFREDQVLLIRRGREPGRGRLSIPGGGVKLGEALEQALRREMREETGLTVEPVALVDVLDRIIPEDDGRIRYHYVLVDYLCVIKGGGLQAGCDALEARFYPLESLPKMEMTPGTEEVIRKGKFLLDKQVFD